MTVDLNNYSNIEYLVLMSVNSNKNKYWADDDFGSDLFLLKNSKVSKSTAANVKRNIEDSLSWLVDDELVKSIDVETSLNTTNGKSRIDWQIKITKPNEYNEIIKGVWKNYADA